MPGSLKATPALAMNKSRREASLLKMSAAALMESNEPRSRSSRQMFAFGTVVLMEAAVDSAVLRVRAAR